MKIIKDKIKINDLRKMSEKMFGGLVKAVVDIKKEVLVVDAPMHADQEAFLIKEGSNQNDLWGINLYPDKKNKDFIEFDSMINIRSSWGNRTRSVDNPKIREKIVSIINNVVTK